jgi:hypothetical protein
LGTGPVFFFFGCGWLGVMTGLAELALSLTNEVVSTESGFFLVTTRYLVFISSSVISFLFSEMFDFRGCEVMLD